MPSDFHFFKKNFLFLFFGLCLMSSCSYKNSSRILKYPKNFKTDTLTTIAVYNQQESYLEYRIKPYDKISIKNLQDPELLGARFSTASEVKLSYEVSNTGEIILPAIGSIKIAGLTKEQAREKIQKLYGESLFKDPIIELNINTLKVTLLGAFKTEGNFILQNPKTDLIDIIGISGGIEDDANVKSIRIIRGNRENPELIMANLSNVNTLSNPKLTLQDGDIIIAERNRFAVFAKNINPINTIASIGLILINTYIIIKNTN